VQQQQPVIPASGSPDPGDARTGKPTMALLWPVALTWLALQATGRGLGRFHDAYSRAASRAGRATVNVAVLVLRRLRPLARLLEPAGRLLRQVWDRMGLLMVRFVTGPLARAARRILLVSRPLVERLLVWGRRFHTRLQPILQVLSNVATAVAEIAALLARGLRWMTDPVRRVATALVAMLPLRERSRP
jgi:hypothetical protein